jgi:dolichyl-phosphate-mannose--protein O-mannosyl transferase
MKKRCFSSNRRIDLSCFNSQSGQQLVTFIQDPASQNTLWLVRPADHSHGPAEYPEEASCKLAGTVKCGDTIRLSHVSTGRNLHSHHVESVLSKQQEITCYGVGDGLGDTGDDWKVECKGSYWKRGLPVRLRHTDTGRYLGTSKQTEFNVNTCGRNCPIMNHLEAFGRAATDGNTLLKADHGIYLSL